MFKTILAAVDASPRAPHVVRAACDVAKRFGATVHLFRAVTLPPEIPAAAKMPEDDVPKAVAEVALDKLRILAQPYSGVVLETPFVGLQQPWRAILEAAERVKADLIVIGSHGYTAWERMLGTTAANVANRAGRAVLVVHPDGHS